MRELHHPRRNGQGRRGYRDDWTVAGLVVSLATVPLLVAVLAVPGLVLAAAFGAATATLVAKVTGHYGDRSSREAGSSTGRLRRLFGRLQDRRS